MTWLRKERRAQNIAFPVMNAGLRPGSLIQAIVDGLATALAAESSGLAQILTFWSDLNMMIFVLIIRPRSHARGGLQAGAHCAESAHSSIKNHRLNEGRKR